MICEDFDEKKILVKSPAEGEIIDISDVNDYVFSKKLVGDGVAVKIKTSEIVAPVDGTVKLILPTKHGIGIETSEGIDILLHVNMDEADFSNELFHSIVKEEDKVSVGDKLLLVNENLLKDRELVLCIVVANMSVVKEIKKNYKNDISKEDTLFEITI
ncbi:PTS glucose transporter subunit IIBC [Clostridium acetobutylicum]|nr:PTS glucose transporter subunit IIBC [Clostridium acetobutylicum]